MTGKRFTLAYSDYDWWAICDKENPTKRGISDNDVVDLLNQLNDKNKQLKQQNEYLKSLKWNQDCINEISIGMQQRQSLERQNNKLVKENEQLKKTEY